MLDVFSPYDHDSLHLKNRIIRSGVYEGRCDTEGFPSASYIDFYRELAKNEVGGIITGFAFISKEGRAMQPRQAGIDHPDKIPYFRKMTAAVHQYDCPVFLQIAHTGRQTLKRATGMNPRGASNKSSVYFRGKPITLTTEEVRSRIQDFAEAACLAREAGFDGVQLHSAHGYLIHQFILPAVNNRRDEFGIDKASGIGTAFLGQIIKATREKCGDDFPIMVKISGDVDLKSGFPGNHFEALLRFLERMKVAAIEVSYGTMDHALNIFRGDIPESVILKHNPVMISRNLIRREINKIVLRNYFIKKLKPFTPAYNLEYASIAKKICEIPVISVGGFRGFDEILQAIQGGKTDLVGMARPFICEPDLMKKMKINGSYKSECINCNICSVMCDSENETRCYNS